MAASLKSSAVECHTPDGRYFVVRGRLWRCTDPALDIVKREELVRALMTARRSMRRVTGPQRVAARETIDATKIALGERGAVWWTDGAPDYNRCMVVNTPYADWYRETMQTSRSD